MADEKQGNKLNIEIPEDIAEGTYSNLAIISHSNSTFRAISHLVNIIFKPS